MEKVSLMTMERVLLTSMIAEQQSDVVGLRKWFKVLDKVEVSEEAKKEIGLRQVDQNITWDAEKDKALEIELEDDLFNMVKVAMEQKKNWPLDRMVMQLLDKFVKE